jgi:hypothetical protein
LEGEVPQGPQLLQVIPWMERRSTDMLKYKEGLEKVGSALHGLIRAPERTCTSLLASVA